MKLNKKAGILSMLIFAGAACPAVFAEQVPQSSVLSGVVTSVVEENAVVDRTEQAVERGLQLALELLVHRVDGQQIQ